MYSENRGNINHYHLNVPTVPMGNYGDVCLAVITTYPISPIFSSMLGPFLQIRNHMYLELGEKGHLI